MTAPALPLERPSTFPDVLLSEWTKIRTLRSTFFSLAAAVVIVIGMGTLISYESGLHYTPVGWDPTTISLSALIVGQLAIAVLGVLSITGEYSTGMIRTTFAAVPRRGRLLAAKALVFTGVALVTGEILSWVAFALGQAVMSGHAPTASLGQANVARAVSGAGLYVALIGLMAVAIGTLVRHTAGAIVSVVAILFVLPGVLQALPSSWRNPVEEYWPTNAGAQIIKVTQGVGVHELSAGWGFGEFALFVAVLLGLAYWLLNRRDA
jgi:ABC-type transport system involved in multi-copper enzyme maturation permease subunit